MRHRHRPGLESNMSHAVVILCPGQGAQAIGMGKAWADASPAARAVFEEADETLRDLPGGARLSELCWNGPADLLNRTDVSQPALYTAGIACWRALRERQPDLAVRAAAGLSLGEYTALHIAGAVGFADGLRLVALRGRLMQQAAEASKGSMVALIGADDAQAQAVCDAAAQGEVLVSANFNAPGQIVLSGHAAACQRAVEAASTMGFRATALQVAGAFHSPLMAPAADGLAKALASVEFRPLATDVWSNVTAKAHDRNSPETVKKLLVEQLVRPVRWSQSCADLIGSLRSSSSDGSAMPKGYEMAPGTVLKGLMRRIDRAFEVTSHDAP
jgi:[acyl-carrier-protein] S-malonyltransferase